MPLELRRFLCQPLTTNKADTCLAPSAAWVCRTTTAQQPLAHVLCRCNDYFGWAQSVSCTLVHLFKLAPAEHNACEMVCGASSPAGHLSSGTSSHASALPGLSYPQPSKEHSGALRSPKAPAAILLESAHELPLEEASGGVRPRMPRPWRG